MTKVKVKFRSSRTIDQQGTISYIVSHCRIVREIKTNYKVYPGEWDEQHSVLIKTKNNSKERIGVLCMIGRRIQYDLARLKFIIMNYDLKNQEYTSDDIVAEFKEYARLCSFNRFINKVIVDLKKLNKQRTAENYISALNSFMCFRKRNDLVFEEMTSDLMQEYEAWLKDRGVKKNTISFYNRILRSVYNRAVDKGIVSQYYPFKHVYTGIDATVKRAISLKDMKHIKELDLSLNPSLEFARDMFLFSFYLRGMSFVDMAYLKNTDLKDGILTYQRRKTKQTLQIKWLPCMNDIVIKYTNTETDYMLPIIKKTENDSLQYRNALRLVNSKLKVIGRMAGLPINLTMYTSRHSWCSIAHEQNIPISVISDGMGHKSERTTLIYLASLDTSKVDKANEQILCKL